MAARTILHIFSAIEIWYQAGTFGTRHELEREIKSSRTQLLVKFFLALRGRMQIIARTLLDSSYDFITTPLVHTDADVIILPCQGFSDKKILSLLSDRLRQIFDYLYRARILGRDKLVS